jgi:hypothetical protein
VRLELGVVKLLDRVLHVLVTNELNDARSIVVDVGITDVASLPHVIFQVLPAASWRKTRHQNPVF